MHLRFFGSSRNNNSRYPANRGNPSATQAPSQRNNAASGDRTRPSVGPGAFSVDRGGRGNQGTVFRVTIPAGVRPGEEFQVYAGNRIVRVRCPSNVRPNQSLQITVPADNQVVRHRGGAASLTNNRDYDQQGAPAPDRRSAHSAGVQLIPTSSGQAAYMVTIPARVRGGEQFPVTISGQQLMVTCPANANPGMRVRVIPPPSAGGQNAPSSGRDPPRESKPSNKSAMQMFEVVVPQGASPGQPFALMAGGQRVLVTCPLTASPGQRIRFQLPMELSQPSKGRQAPDVTLSYDKDGWTRSIRVGDMKFQWIRMDEEGAVDLNKRFDHKTSAYVRQIEFFDGEDTRMRCGAIGLVPASEAVVDSKIPAQDGKSILVTYGDIAKAQRMPFDDKAKWFQDTCSALCVEWNEGHMRINIRREFLLNDSMEAVMSLGRKDLRKVWRFEFIGEAGIDAGGLAREWFQLITEEIFNPDKGLWQSSPTNQSCMQINPNSKLACADDHLIYFRFLGRIMGKALFDHQLVHGHMVRHLYKHLLSWPCMFQDLELVDEEYYQNLKKMIDYSPEEVEMLCLDFTVTQTNMGAVETIELLEGGVDMEVSAENLPEYLECCFRYRMMDRVKDQLTELLLGFFDIIPEPLLTIFDFQELELIMCGLPNIDIEDWKANTLYTGEYDRNPNNHVCQWFWEVVEEEFDDELKARLLQFVTGTSGVPSRGFSVLQSNDGNIRRFTVHGVKLALCMYPRAHTCFNRIDLPVYTSKADLHEKLKLAVQMEATGFGIE